MLPGPCQGTVPLIPTPCGVLPEHFCPMCLVMLRHSFPSDHHRLPIPGWSRLCHVRFPNLLPERILPFPEKTVCERCSPIHATLGVGAEMGCLWLGYTPSVVFCGCCSDLWT